MSTPFSTPTPDRSPQNRHVILTAAVATLVTAFCAAPVAAQMVVYDPRNHLENALHAARQLESLANEARSLAASPYSHLTQNSQTLQDMAALARSAQGLATTVSGLERQFDSLYPDDPSASGVLDLIAQGQARSDAARRTAGDLARHAAELERLGDGRSTRLSGALSASQSAQGQTAAVQSSNQILAVLAEDLAALRGIMLAQSRLMAEQAVRAEADRAAGDAARRQAWGGPTAVPAPPRFDPLARARD